MKSSFDSIAWFNSNKCVCVLNPVDTESFVFLLGKVVSIDGVNYRVRSVDKQNHNPPWLKGEKIVLTVERLRNDG